MNKRCLFSYSHTKPFIYAVLSTTLAMILAQQIHSAPSSM